MAHDQPLISIIIACLNSADTLMRCLTSIETQTYQNREVIIIDGGSTDGSTAILRSFQEQVAYIESSPDNGIYHAWNKALKHVSGDWLCFLGADDFFFHDQSLENIIIHLKLAHDQQIYYVYSKTAIMSKAGDLLTLEGKPWNNLKERNKQFPQITHSGTFHHKYLFEKHGAFDESFAIAGDYEFLLRELSSNDAYFADDTITVGHTIGGISRRLENRFSAINEALAARNRHIKGIPWSFFPIYAQLSVYLILTSILGRALANHFVDVYRICTGKAPVWSKSENV